MLTACSEVRFIYHYSVILQHCIQIEEASYNSGLVASKYMINSNNWVSCYWFWEFEADFSPCMHRFI